MPSPVFTAAVSVTTNPVSTPLISSATHVSLFDSPIGVSIVSEKEMPATYVAGETTSARDATRYQPKWKIAESSRLIFPQVVHHWVERAYPPAKSTYVEG
ncbi:hypothetical protein Hanom_Chr06g00560731 [Helianthus anomalus]